MIIVIDNMQAAPEGQSQDGAGMQLKVSRIAENRASI
jgi:hypothetical protein